MHQCMAQSLGQLNTGRSIQKLRVTNKMYRCYYLAHLIVGPLAQGLFPHFDSLSYKRGRSPMPLLACHKGFDDTNTVDGFGNNHGQVVLFSHT